MIFRKENRSESFQRQISNLRQQLQTETEPHTDEYRFGEPQETSQFATSDRGESVAPARSTDFSGTMPVATPAGPTPAPRGSWQTPDTNTSVIAGNAHWNGTLRTEGSLHVHGRADGELHATHDLYVAEGAQVDAEIYADNVVVAGLVRGRVEARSRLEVLPQGHVSGDVKAPKLVVHEGARLSGQLQMEGSGSSAEAQYSTGSAGSKARRSGQ
ncbi:MAG: polymer-forming cytoskeletal protein [Sphaerobacter sp.]|nr:polymer-forming cytoskeletal protein [Sphaerobacter sp.]